MYWIPSRGGARCGWKNGSWSRCNSWINLSIWIPQCSVFSCLCTGTSASFRADSKEKSRNKCKLSPKSHPIPSFIKTTWYLCMCVCGGTREGSPKKQSCFLVLLTAGCDFRSEKAEKERVCRSFSPQLWMVRVAARCSPHWGNTKSRQAARFWE